MPTTTDQLLTSLLRKEEQKALLRKIAPYYREAFSDGQVKVFFDMAWAIWVDRWPDECVNPLDPDFESHQQQLVMLDIVLGAYNARSPPLSGRHWKDILSLQADREDRLGFPDIQITLDIWRFVSGSMQGQDMTGFTATPQPDSDHADFDYVMASQGLPINTPWRRKLITTSPQDDQWGMPPLRSLKRTPRTQINGPGGAFHV